MLIEPQEGRIAVALEGHEFDLEDACDAFPLGGKAVQVCRIVIPPNEKYVLLSEMLNELTDESEIARISQRLIDLVNGVLFIDNPLRQPIRRQGIHHRQSVNGNWGVTINVPAAFARGRAGKISFAQKVVATEQQSQICLALADEVVLEVLSYLRDTPDWLDLYKAHETMQADLSVRFGQKGQKIIGWPEKKIKIFTEVANGARHGKKSERVREKRERKGEAVMSLPEARQFVRELCQLWLKSIDAQNGS
ncbi:hypothetical protein LOC51_32750 [Rubrivivax sp. JA1024]|nr:hypothetical protein [Rubrivivax sp. JA1024]